MESQCYEDQIIMLKSNYNLASFVYSEMVSQRYILSFDDGQPFTTCVCDDADNIQLKLIKKIDKNVKFERLDVNWNIFYNILNGSYIKHIDLNNEQIYTPYNGQFIKYNPINNKLFNTKMDLHIELINKIDITMNFNKLYDIVERNGTKYIFSIELTHICYSKFRNSLNVIYDEPDNDNIYKKMDILLHSFNHKFKNVFNQIILDLIGKEDITDTNKIMDFVENDTYIHGIYKCNLCVYDDNYNKNIHLIDTMYMNVYEQNIILDIIKKKCPLHIETKEFLIKYGILTQPRMKELLEDMTEYIKTQTLPKKKKWDRKVKIAFEDFMNIIFKYDRDGKFCSNEIILKKNAYKYMKNNNRTKYIYSEQYTHKSVKPITDEDLFSLFNPKTKPKKTKPLTNKPIIKPTIEPIIEPTNAFIEPKPLLKLYNLKIEYVYNVEKDKILENHLNYIVNYLDRFTKLYETYNSVLVIKSYDKYYTKHKYFNFRFGRDKYASKCFHVYLTDDLSDIVNITYIESIELG